MAPPSVTGEAPLTNAEVADSIITDIDRSYTKAPDTGDLAYLGRAFHPVQDSFFIGHVMRDNAGLVTSFQLYGDEDPQSHSKYDVPGPDGDWRKIPGVFEGIEATRDIADFYRQCADFKTVVEPYLRQNVYRIAPGFENVPAGVVDERAHKHSSKGM